MTPRHAPTRSTDAPGDAESYIDMRGAQDRGVLTTPKMLWGFVSGLVVCVAVAVGTYINTTSDVRSNGAGIAAERSRNDRQDNDIGELKRAMVQFTASQTEINRSMNERLGSIDRKLDRQVWGSSRSATNGLEALPK